MKIGIELTRKCNKLCWFCYNNSVPEADVELDFTELSRFIEELSQLPQRPILCFGGGEPLLYSCLDDLIILLEKNKYPYSITTNTTYLGKKDVVSKMQVGWLWGSIHFPHEVDRVISKLRTCGAKNYGVVILVMKSYIPRIYDVIEKVEDAKIPYIITFFKTYGRAKERARGHYESLTTEEIKDFLKTLCQKYDGVYSDSCLEVTGKIRCTCGVNWFTITADKLLKPNSFYPVGAVLRELSWAEFNRVKGQVPKRVHEIETD